MLHDSDRQMQALIDVKKASSYASVQHSDNESKRLKLWMKKESLRFVLGLIGGPLAPSLALPGAFGEA